MNNLRTAIKLDPKMKDKAKSDLEFSKFDLGLF